MVQPLRPAVPPDKVSGPAPVPRPRPATEPTATTELTAPTAPTESTAAGGVPPAPAATELAAATTTSGSTEAAAGAGPEQDGSTAAPAPGSPPTSGRRRRLPFAHAVRVPPPRQLAVAAARATRDWSRRPSGRTTLGGLFLLALVAATAAAGALVVPATVGKPRPVAVDATATEPAGGVPAGGAVPGATDAPTGAPGATDPATGTPPPYAGQPTGRPADALAGWAAAVSQKTGIPVVAVQAYGYAELVLRETHRSCQLSWTTLAAIGYVESRHGSANGATLGPNGVAAPEIRGDPLDGQGGRLRIRDTDQGRLDGDTVHDRAIGPMQFIPSTWQEIGADADNDGVKNPHDIDDAALAAGQYLCKAGRNLTVPGDWWAAILSYNDVRRYAQDVFNKADEYGRLSGT
ncbi:Membrane-bound lytic murein transglycosylase B [Micromonospora viridifaciens]|uniref:Membrane-bound lytic murein transglycosylase B n=1 Tax=Micromonospora viridifaciens TaxID=1881 RepID=A0A1C4UXT3_MICVI|nr:Membrane-bound lytic murein transglycosylase B [Micromonospora viridifaciens]